MPFKVPSNTNYSVVKLGQQQVGCGALGRCLLWSGVLLGGSWQRSVS